MLFPNDQYNQEDLKPIGEGHQNINKLDLEGLDVQAAEELCNPHGKISKLCFDNRIRPYVCISTVSVPLFPYVPTFLQWLVRVLESCGRAVIVRDETPTAYNCGCRFQGSLRGSLPALQMDPYGAVTLESIGMEPNGPLRIHLVPFECLQELLGLENRLEFTTPSG